MKKTAFSLSLLLLSAALQANTALPDVSPVAEGQHVVINIPQQRLFLYTDGKLSKIYPVAVGKAATQTNLGRHIIGPKAFNPTWHIPKSIQRERGDGVTSIPPGPSNPLGPVFVRMGDPKLGLGIHGTNAPSSVPGVRSHGCVRMKSPDALEFAKTIQSGSPADVIYQMASLNADADNNLWLAAFRDPYSKGNLDTAALRKSMAAWAKAHGKTLHAKRVDAVLKARTGSLNCITCGSSSGSVKGSLKSLAWLSGEGRLSKPKAVEHPAGHSSDNVLPEGSSIEVDAGGETREVPVKPLPPAAPASAPHSKAGKPAGKPSVPMAQARKAAPAAARPAATAKAVPAAQTPAPAARTAAAVPQAATPVVQQRKPRPAAAGTDNLF